MILLLPLAFALFVANNRLLANLLFFGFMTSGFGLVPSELFGVKAIDGARAYVVLCSIYLWIAGEMKVADLRGMRFIKPLTYFGLSLFASLMLGLLYHGDSFYETVNFLRKYSLLLSFLPLVYMKTDSRESLMRWLAYLVFAQTFIYVLQPFVGYQILIGTPPREDGFMGFQRYYNIPLLTLPMTIYFIFTKTTMLKKAAYVGLGILATLFCASRGGLAGAILAVVFGKMCSGNIIKNISLSILMALLTFGISTKIFEGELGRKTISDIKLSLSGDYYSDYSEGRHDQDATFSFRISLLAERFNYLWHHPRDFLFGVGAVHEFSPRTREFGFIIGTRCDECPDGYTTIETVDIAWATLLMRLGIIGTTLYLLSLSALFVEFWINRKTSLGLIGVTIIAYYFLTAIGNGELARQENFVLLFLLWALNRAAIFEKTVSAAYSIERK